MKVSLYLSQYHKEIIKNEVWYQLVFFDNINGLVFKTYIHKKNLILDYIDLIDNGNPETLERLKKEVL